MTGKQGGRPTIRDVAERAGVSMQTVSNVINDRPVTRPETRLRVEQAIRELGYERDALARALRLQRSHVLGFFIEDQSHLALQDPTHAALLTGMVEAARQREYAVTVLVAAPDRPIGSSRRCVSSSAWPACSFRCKAQRASARDLLERMAALGMPTVIFEQHTDVPGVASVTSDNEEGRTPGRAPPARPRSSPAGDADGATAWPGGERRFAGFSGRDLEGRAPRSAPCASDAWSVEAARAAARPLLAGERPTAVFAANDVLAVGVLLAAQDVGLRFPTTSPSPASTTSTSRRWCALP